MKTQTKELMPMVSINPPYTNMIFKKIKIFEFRNRIMKTVVNGNTLLIYETKNKKGCGKVIGQASIKDIYEIEYDIAQVVERMFDTCPYEFSDLELKLYDVFSSLCKSYEDLNRENYHKYLQSIGYGAKYAIELHNPILYGNLNNKKDFESREERSNLNYYTSSKDTVVVRPPQNMFNVYIKQSNKKQGGIF